MPIRTTFPPEQHRIAQQFLPSDYPDWFSETPTKTPLPVATLQSIVGPAASFVLFYGIAFGAFVFIAHAASYFINCFT